MRRINISYPYPVLGLGDDIITEFPEQNVEVEVFTTTNDDFAFQIHLIQPDPTIAKLIDTGVAEFMVEVDCPRTLYRRCYTQDSDTFNIPVPRHSVLDKIYFRPYVMVKEQISYLSPSFNPDYDGCVFDLERGDVLAIFNEFDYNASLEYDKLAAFDSIIKIRRDDNISDIKYDLEGSKIYVLMPTNMYTQYDTFKRDPQFKEVMHSSLVMNALLYTLYNGDWDSDEDDGKSWKYSIRYRVEHEEEFAGFDLNDPSCYPSLAQALLKDPYGRLFQQLSATEYNLTQIEE